MITGFRRILRAGFVGFWRNAYVSLASIFVITIALFVIGSTMMIDKLLVVSLEQLQAKVDINVYFVTTAKQDDIDALRTSLEALPDVALVTYTSREEALSKYRARYQSDTVAMQALDELKENPLGATIAIQAKEVSQYENIASFLDEQKAGEEPQNPIISKINYADKKESINKLQNIIDAVERGSYISQIVLIVAAIMITFNTIRLAIYTAREEISIMRLVGAGNMFIRGPFMLQGLMYGFIAGVMALLILYPNLLWLGPITGVFFGFNIFDYFVGNFSSIFGTLIGIGMALGLVSSVLAVARYLRV